MPTQSFAEFERTWPWLSNEEAQAKVEEGKHSMNLNQVRQTAEQLGYEEWFYCTASDSNFDSNGNNQCTSKGETLAFIKRFQDHTEKQNGSVVKVLYYPRTGAVSICTFQFHPSKDCEAAMEIRPVLEEGENLYSWLGIVAASPENSDLSKADALFNPHSEKSFQAIPKVSKLKQWKGLLLSASSNAETSKKNKRAHPSSDADATALVQFKRTDWLLGRWQKPGEMDSPCCQCNTTTTKWVFDCALRWHHMATAVGFGMEHIPTICKVCQLMDNTLFEVGPASLSRTRFNCGSYCAILELLLDIAKQYHNAIGFTGTKEANQLLEGRLRLPIRGHHYGVTFGEGCELRQEFLAEGHGESLEKLKATIIALPANIRLEVIVFFFERTSNYYGVKTLIDSHFMPLWSPLYPLLRNASLDYSRLFAGDNSEEQYCYRCGLFHRSGHHDEDDEAMDENTVATEVSISSESMVSSGDDESIATIESIDGN